MNRALRFTLLGLAAVVVLFAVTWFSLPGSACDNVSPPASLFMPGLDYTRGGTGTVTTYGGSKNGYGAHHITTQVITPGRPHESCVHLHALKSRIVVFYGSAAAVIVLVGLAFGAGRRSPQAS